MFEIAYINITLTFWNAHRRRIDTYPGIKKVVLLLNDQVFYKEYEKYKLHEHLTVKKIFTPKCSNYIIDFNFELIHKMGKPVYNPNENKNQLNYIYHGTQQTKHIPKTKN